MRTSKKLEQQQRAIEKLAFKLSVGPIDPDGIYNMSESCMLLGISRPTLKRFVANGMLEPPVQRNPDAVGHTASKVNLGQHLIDCRERMLGRADRLPVDGEECCA